MKEKDTIQLLQIKIEGLRKLVYNKGVETRKLKDENEQLTKNKDEIKQKFYIASTKATLYDELMVKILNLLKKK